MHHQPIPTTPKLKRTEVTLDRSIAKRATAHIGSKDSPDLEDENEQEISAPWTQQEEQS